MRGHRCSQAISRGVSFSRALQNMGTALTLFRLLLAHPYETVGYEVFKTERSLMDIDKSALVKKRS